MWRSWSPYASQNSGLCEEARANWRHDAAHVANVNSERCELEGLGTAYLGFDMHERVNTHHRNLFANGLWGATLMSSSRVEDSTLAERLLEDKTS
jgi:hypothetical protein